MERPAVDEALARLLAGGSPREVLARIARADSLGLRARIARRMRERVLLLDAERVHLRALAVTANAAPGRRWEGRIGPWLDERVDEALDALLNEGPGGRAPGTDPRSAPPTSGGRPPGGHRLGEPGGDGLEVFAQRLGLEPTALRHGLAAFHRLPRGHRSALVDVVLRAPDADPESAGPGPDGPDGPDGSDGSDGPDGPDGPDGLGPGELHLQRARQAFATILRPGDPDGGARPAAEDDPSATPTRSASPRS